MSKKNLVLTLALQEEAIKDLWAFVNDLCSRIDDLELGINNKAKWEGEENEQIQNNIN